MEIIEVPGEGNGSSPATNGMESETPGVSDSGAKGNGDRKTVAAFRVTVSTLKKEIGKFQEFSAGRAWRAALRSIGAEVSTMRLLFVGKHFTDILRMFSWWPTDLMSKFHLVHRILSKRL